MTDDNCNWITHAFRQSVVAKIDAAIRQSGMSTSQNSLEMENHAYQKAKNRQEYIGFVARLILHVRKNKLKPGGGMAGPRQGLGGPGVPHPINALQNLASQGSHNPMMNMGPQPGQLGGPQQGTATNLLQTLNRGPALQMMLGNMPANLPMQTPPYSNQPQASLQHTQQQQQQQQRPMMQQQQQQPPSQANYVIQPPKMNQRPQQQRPLPSCISSSLIQRIIENTQISEKFTNSIRMLVLLETGEQRLITFTLPKKPYTVQEILEQVNVPFQSNMNIQVTEVNSSGINYIVTIGNVAQRGYDDTSTSKEPSPLDIQKMVAANKPNLQLDEDSVNTTLICRTVRIGSYRCVPADKKVLVDSKFIVMKVPHPSIEKQMKLIKIETNAIVKVLASFSNALPVFFYYLNPAHAKLVRETLGMTPGGDYYFDPLATDEESHRRITLLPDDLTEDDIDIFQLIYDGMMDELNPKEANDILIKTCPKDVPIESHIVST